MLYHLRIDKTRYAGKTFAECCDIIAARADKINIKSRVPAEQILLEFRAMSEKYRCFNYYGHDGKVFISINRGKQNVKNA